MENNFTKNEAPLSVSSTMYYRGVSITITQRDPNEDIKPLLREELKTIDWMLDTMGALPSWNSETNKQVATINQPKEFNKEQTPIPVEDFQEVCEKCGAKKILSKKGNMVCSAFCWTKR